MNAQDAQQGNCPGRQETVVHTLQLILCLAVIISLLCFYLLNCTFSHLTAWLGIQLQGDSEQSQTVCSRSLLMLTQPALPAEA